MFMHASMNVYVHMYVHASICVHEHASTYALVVCVCAYIHVCLSVCLLLAFFQGSFSESLILGASDELILRWTEMYAAIS